MASQEETDLCCEILKEFFGDLAEKVLISLFNFGRLTTAQISKHTDLPIFIVRRALVPLVQYRFVLYWTTPDAPKVCHYYANPTNIIHCLAIPQILTTITARYPNNTSSAPEIIKNIFAYGHIRASDYIEGAAHQSLDTASTEPANDSEMSINRARSNISKSITELVSKKYLIPLFDFDFKPVSDLKMDLFQKELKKLPRTSSESSRKTSATDSMERLYAELLLNKDATNSGLIPKSLVREKSVNGLNSVMAGAVAAPTQISQNMNLPLSKLCVDPQAVLSINFDRFMVVFRNDELAGVAARNVGRVSAYVYRHLLKCYEEKLLRCSQNIVPESGFNITTMSVMNSLDKSIDISTSIVTKIPQNGSVTESLAAKRAADEDDEDDDPYLADYSAKRPKLNSTKDSPFITEELFEADNDIDLVNGNGQAGIPLNGNGFRLSAADVNRHLELIAASPLKLLVKQGNRGGGDWFVPFANLSDTMRRLRYDEIIQHKFGTEALRVLRIVREKGMANDELLARTALLRSDTIHRYCLQLHSFGALELQEVPRSADRAPSKTIFMWFHRPQHAYALAEEYVTKALTRILKRIRSERLNHPILLAKLQREDVKENEDMYLTAQEKQEILQLRTKEEKLFVQVNRLQSLRRVFSEY